MVPVTTVPLPGQRVRGSRSGAPIMALLDLLGRRWALGVLWSVCEAGPATFRTIQARCETISPAVLNQRLKELQAAKFVTRSADGYVATELGRNLYAQLLPLGATAREWAELLGNEAGAAPIK